MTSPAYTRRIMGIETEYGLTMRPAPTGEAAPTPAPDPEDIARILFQPIVRALGTSNVFTANGSRAYLDVGAHPEYATVECDSLSQLLSYERAGDLLFDSLARTAERALEESGTPGSIYLLKNNVDSVGNSYGCHENYLLGRSTALKSFGRRLLPFLVTRQLICGAGMVKPATAERPARFVISQRAEQVFEGVSSATTRSRPIINTRDEPHADSHRFRRMHVIVGDSNMAEPTFALKVGATQLVIEMLEAGFLAEPMELHRPIDRIRQIAEDPTGSTLLDRAAGGTITALEVQEELYDAATRWLPHRPAKEGTPNGEMARVVDLWGRMLEALRSQNFSAVDTEIDWVIKKKLLDGYRERLGGGWEHPRLAQIDLLYHDIRPGRGLYSVLLERGVVHRWIDDQQINQALHNPPETTRGYLRGSFVTRSRQLGAPNLVDWSQLKVNRPEPQLADLVDPFATQDPEFDRLMEYMSTHRDFYEGPITAPEGW